MGLSSRDGAQDQQRLLPRRDRTDALTFAAIAVLFLGVAALARWLPALRAGGLDPNVVLPEE